MKKVWLLFVLVSLILNCNSNKTSNKGKPKDEIKTTPFYVLNNEKEVHMQRFDSAYSQKIDVQKKCILANLSSQDSITIYAGDEGGTRVLQLIFDKNFNLIILKQKFYGEGEMDEDSAVYYKDNIIYFYHIENWSGMTYEKARIYYQKGSPYCGNITKINWNEEYKTPIDTSTKIEDNYFGNLNKYIIKNFSLKDLDSCIFNLQISKKEWNNYLIDDSSILHNFNSPYSTTIAIDTFFYKRYKKHFNKKTKN